MRVSLAKEDFSGGLLSKGMLARVQSAPYAAGLSDSLNFIPTKTGGSRNIPGSYRVASATTTAGSRIEILYNVKSTKFWVVEFTNLKARCYQGWGNLASRQTYTDLTTTITTAELFEFQVAQSKGLMYIAHASHPVQLITVSTTDTLAISVPTLKTGVADANNIFATADNYPSVVHIAQKRLILGGTNAEPTVLCFSREADFAKFGWDSTPIAKNGFVVEDNALAGSRLSWVDSAGYLIIGTTAGVYMTSSPYLKAITDSAAAGTDIVPVSGVGCAPIRPVMLNQAVLFLGRSGNSLNLLQIGADGAQVSELTRLQSSALRVGARQIAAMTKPIPSVWLTMNDGTALVVELDFESGIIAFSPIDAGIDVVGETETNRTFRSIAISKLSYEDEIWDVSSDSVGSFVDVRAPFDPALDTTLGNGEPHYVESGWYKYDGVGFTAWNAGATTGHSYSTWADGSPKAPLVASGTTITFATTVYAARAGYKRRGYISPTIPDVAPQGSGQGKIRAIEDIKVRVIDSYAGAAGPSLDNLSEFLYLVGGEYVGGTALPAYTGVCKTRAFGWSTDNPTVYVVQDDPAPMEVGAVIFVLQILEEGN
jgi:hypothetical protein